MTAIERRAYDFAMTDSSTIFFNPLEPGYVEDPYSHFAQMREHDPVHLTLVNQWLLFAYDDVSRLLRDPSLSVSNENIEIHDEDRMSKFIEVAGEDFERSTSMLNVDPPDHTRLRRLVSKAFTPSSIEALRPRVQVLVDEMLDAIRRARRGRRRDRPGLPAAVRRDLRDVGDARIGQGADRRVVGCGRQDARSDHHRRGDRGGGRRRTGDERPHRRGRRVEAGEPGRRPADGVDRRRGERRPTVVGGAARPGARCCSSPGTRPRST